MSSVPENFNPAPDMLRGKTILVTGATGGYGKAISLALAGHGATVVLLAKNLRLVEGLYDEIEAAGFPVPAIYPKSSSASSCMTSSRIMPSWRITSIPSSALSTG